MGKFSSKPKAGPSAEEIRKQEEARINAENKKALAASEAKRQSLRARAVSGDEDVVSRKTLLGQ